MAPVQGAVVSAQDAGRREEVRLPAQPGNYRLFVHTHNGHGNATTANVPLRTANP